MIKPCTPVPLLFFCDGNAERARMAAGLLATRSGAQYDIYCAGMDSPDASEWAIRVMNEISIPIPHYHAADLNDYQEIRFAYVITICDETDHSCLDFPRDGHVSHWRLANPADVKGSDAQVLDAYRLARDGLGGRVEAWLAAASTNQAGTLP